MSSFSERLKELRLKSGAKQTDIAKHINVLPRAIRFYESGEREPNHEITIKLADFFKVSVDYLLGRSDSPVSRGDTTLAKRLRELRKEKNVTIEDVADYLGELGTFYWKYEAAVNHPPLEEAGAS